jgi:hypothetical protein
MATIEIERPCYTRPYYMRREGRLRLRWDCSAHAPDDFEPKTKMLDPDWEVAIRQGWDLYEKLLQARARQGSIVVLANHRPGTLGGLFEAQKKHPTFTKFVTVDTCNRYCARLDRVGKRILRVERFRGLRLSEVPLAELTVAAAKMILYDLFDLGLAVFDVKGYNRCRELLRTVFNNMVGEYEGVPLDNPIKHTRHLRDKNKRKRLGASILHLAYLDYGARLEGAPYVGTAALATFELQLRSTAAFTCWFCEHWKPADQPNQVYLVRPKVGNSRWIDLHDAWGNPYFPALEARLDAIKGDRKTGILIPRDGTYDTPWAPPDAVQLPKDFYALFGRIKKRVSLPDALEWSSFRRGGITESAEAGCTENELMCLSGHLDPRTARLYITETMRMVGNAQRKRIAQRAEVIQGLIAAHKLDKLRDDPEFQELMETLAPLVTTEIQPNDL